MMSALYMWCQWSLRGARRPRRENAGEESQLAPLTRTYAVLVRTEPPGLEGIIAGETALSYIDGENGRLLYRGFPIGQLVKGEMYGLILNFEAVEHVAFGMQPQSVAAA